MVSVKRLNNFLNSSELEGYVERHPEKEDMIVVENGSFSWENQEDNNTSITPILKNINFNVPKGKLVAGRPVTIFYFLKNHNTLIFSRSCWQCWFRQKFPDECYFG